MGSLNRHNINMLSCNHGIASQTIFVPNVCRQPLSFTNREGKSRISLFALIPPVLLPALRLLLGSAALCDGRTDATEGAR